MEVLGLVDIPLWMILLTMLIVTWYIYATWHFGHWVKQSIPGPRPYPILGTALGLLKQGIIESDMERQQKYGKVYGIFFNRKPAIVVADKDMLKEILVKDFQHFQNHMGFADFKEEPTTSFLSSLTDEDWRRVRLLLTPTFSAGKLRAMVPHINRCAKFLLENLDEIAAKGDDFEMKSRAGAFTMDSIAATAFGLQLDSQKDPNNDFIKMANKAVKTDFTRPAVLISVFASGLLKYIRYVGLRFFPQDVTDFFMNIVQQALDERSKDNSKKNVDFIQLMKNAHIEQEEIQDKPQLSPDKGDSLPNSRTENKPTDGYDSATIKKGMTHDEIMAQCLIFFFGGYETVASALTFFAYSLATEPEIQEKLIAEVKEVMARSSEPTYEQIKKMVYLDMCLYETLRKFPPATRTDRQCSSTEGVTIGGIPIEKNMYVFIPVYAIHHNPEYYPDPEKFDPERFSPENKADRNPYTFLAFGQGPRNCIGLRLGILEAKIAMVTILMKYRFVTCEKTKIPIEISKFNMQPEGGLFLKLERH